MGMTNLLPAQGTRHLLRRLAQRTAPWARRVEGGSADGGSFGDVVYLPFLLALLLVGVVFAMAGFWRVGASFATQSTAMIGSVAPGEGDSALTTLWHDWSGGGFPGGGFTVDAADRSVNADFSGTQGFDMGAFGFGPWQFSIQAQTHSRSERFYPGGPVCNGDGCDE